MFGIASQIAATKYGGYVRDGVTVLRSSHQISYRIRCSYVSGKGCESAISRLQKKKKKKKKKKTTKKTKTSQTNEKKKCNIPRRKSKQSHQDLEGAQSGMHM